MELTALRARMLLRYCPDSGKLQWRRPKDNQSRAYSREADHENGKGYRVVRLEGRSYMSHRVIWLMEKGYWPERIDHKNGRRDDNRWCNLREANDTQNARNRRLMPNNTSGHCGVFFDQGVWRARITVNGKVKDLGRHSCMANAIAARKAAEKEYGFSKRHGTKQPGNSDFEALERWEDTEDNVGTFARPLKKYVMYDVGSAALKETK